MPTRLPTTWRVRILDRDPHDFSAAHSVRPFNELPTVEVPFDERLILREALTTAAQLAAPSLPPNLAKALSEGRGRVVLYADRFAEDAGKAWGVHNVWGIDDRGLVHLSNLSHSNISLGDFRRAWLEGLNPGDFDRPILIYIAYGGPAHTFDWWEFFSQLSLVVSLAPDLWAASELGKRAGDRLRRRQVKQAAEQFAHRNLKSAYVIREFIDCKQCWTSLDVARKLDISAELAQDILFGLGYLKDPYSDMYRRTMEELPEARRTQWRKMEDDHLEELS
jgi:hypothetical protein